MIRRPRILVAGLGNLLLSDDGAGVHAVRRLRRRRWPRNVWVAEVGTAVLAAMHLIERADTILAVDAMRAGGRPGDVYLCSASDLARAEQPASLHEVTLVSALELLTTPPPPVTVLGIEPESIQYGLDLSPAVAAAMPLVEKKVLEFLLAAET